MSIKENPEIYRVKNTEYEKSDTLTDIQETTANFC